MSDIGVVGVVGAGQMGAGIAEVCARAGVEVRLCDVSRDVVERGMRRIERSLDRAERAGRIDLAGSAAARRRVKPVTDLEQLADAGLVIEAVVEDVAAKLEVFRRLDATVRDPEAILASNTSSLSITKMARSTDRPGQVIGMHFFNPVPVLKLVEIVRSVLTTPATEQRARAFATDVLGKTAILAEDRAGFVVNSLLVPYLLAAIRLHDSGMASAEDMDTGMVLGCAHPMGPLRLADLIGLDTVKAIADAMYEEFKEPNYAPPPALLRMVEAGRLGKKTGGGFYEYADS
jgi:3-hydroxybutyryl-CoA dehydrogenase